MMKKSLLALAALTLAGAASAQSAVTVFGTMDAAARSVKNGSLGSIQSMVSGSNASSKFGLRGTEDLGGGLKAEFWIESDIAADTGAAAATFWSRRSTVSLNSTKVGELRLGRDYVPTHSVSCAVDVFGCVGLANINAFRATQGAVFAGAGNTLLALRANNSVQYITPGNLGGFFAQVMVSAGEGALSSGTEQSKGQGVRVGYIAGPLNVQGAVWQVKNTTAAVSTFKDNTVGASYDFGVVKVGLQRRAYQFSTDKLAILAANLSAPVGPGTVKFQYLKANQTSANAATNANDASLIGLGYQYDLSKRTALYATAARLSNKNTGIFFLPGGPAVTAATFGGQKSTGYEVGLRHNF